MIGFNKSEIETPALLVDLDGMESNLNKMAAFFSGTSCSLRPHFKNHKCLELAQMQLKAGAIGITTATLKETEALVKLGIPSILIANEIAGIPNLKKLISLAKETEVILAVDNAIAVEELVRLSKNKKSKLGLIVDIDLGMKRCGVPPGKSVLRLAEKIISSGLTFKGIMGYEGHLQRLDSSEESTTVVRKKAMEDLLATKDLLVSHKIPVEIVSTGGTGSYALGGTTEGITEIQAGNYLFMDTSYAPFSLDFSPCLTLLTTVISHTPKDRFILNVGVKEISSERGMPTLKNMAGVALEALHAEHAIVKIMDKEIEVKVGDNIELDLYYSDATVSLHSRIYGIRNNKVERIFNIVR